ncbi:hypothetical protein [uncultured Lamprocystis sp.]|jgi:hypothetical protein|uniref:hypothetical protein n=1 Tax=uncultured Lamprocystis sp. TaxID=543132 RepID=UPI0025DB6CC3|nr:hypothetical protein [uncultured Lamprocystis sp.]
MQINGPAIEFFAFIGVTAWLLFIGPKTSRSKGAEPTSTQDAPATDADADEPRQRP